MPSPPEILGIGGLVRGVEILGQVEPHEHRHSDGDVGIARKVGIHLQGIPEYGAQVLEPGEKQGVVKYPVDEIDGDVVAQNYLLDQSVEYPENGNAELLPSQVPRPVHLRDELARANDGSCDQLGKETDEEAEIQDVAYRLELAPVHVHGVTDDLEGEERNAHRQHDAVDTPAVRPCYLVARPGEDIEHLEVNSEQVVDDISEEICVLEIAQQEEVDADAQDQPGFLSAACPGRVYPFRYQEVRAGDEDEYQNRQATGLVVEEETDEEQIGVAEQTAVLDESESREYEGEERPEIELGEKQGRARVKREHPMQEGACRIRDSGHHLFCAL